MANSYFRYKQFLIHQDRCAMKVTTEASILGAVTPLNDAKRILDIGAGTGLLSLMIAQRTTATIDAVEIDPAAGMQCGENFSLSPWKERLTLHRCALQDFRKGLPAIYDHLVVNPPFYSGQLVPDDAARKLAMHDHQMGPLDLISAVPGLLKDTGKVSILYPESASNRFAKLAGDSGLSRLFRAC